MNNQLLAKVLFSNGLATKDQIHLFWGLASDSYDIAAVLRDKGVMSPETYEQVLGFVSKMEGATVPPVATTPEPVAATPVVHPFAPPAGQTPANQAPQASRGFGLSNIAKDRPSLKASSTSLEEAVNGAAGINQEATPDASDSGFSIEGNNPFGQGFQDEVAEKVATIEGMQETRMFELHASAPVAIEERIEPRTEISALPPKDWACGTGDGQPRVQATLVPGGQSRLEALLLFARKQNLSDLYLTPGNTIWARKQGVLQSFSEQICNQADVRRWFHEAVEFAPASLSVDRTKNLRIGLAIQGAGRFRMVATWTSEGPALAFHCVSRSLPTWQELGIPETCQPWTSARQGLILIGGVSGSGRSTTARRLAETTQEARACLTQVIAQPLEAMYSKGTTLYFEPGLHGQSKAQAIREAVLRGNGILLVEDLDSPEDILQVLEASESGMLVIATMEALDHVDLLVRIQEGFVELERSKIRSLLARSTIGIVQQRLTAVPGQAPMAHFEILSMNSTAAGHLRRNELGQIRSILNATRS